MTSAARNPLPVTRFLHFVRLTMEQHFLCQGRSVRAHNPLTSHLCEHLCEHPLNSYSLKYHHGILFIWLPFSLLTTRMSQIHVAKGDIDPLYVWLGTYSKPAWNFAKYLFDGEGHLIGAYKSDKTPAQLKDEIEKLLAWTMHRLIHQACRMALCCYLSAYLVSALTGKKLQLATSMTPGRYLICLWSLTKHELVLEKDLWIFIWSIELLIFVCTKIDSPRWTSFCICCPFFEEPTWASNRGYSKCNDILYSWTWLDATKCRVGIHSAFFLMT